MKTQFLNSHGEVVLSKWWRTQSAQAAVRRVAKANQARFRELKEQKKQEAKLGPVAASVLKRKVRRK